jgi:hypothetical protein
MTTLVWGVSHVNNRLQIEAIAEPEMDLIEVPDLVVKVAQCAAFRKLLDRKNRELHAALDKVIQISKNEFKRALELLEC